jgi:hypothetical protein
VIDGLNSQCSVALKYEKTSITVSSIEISDSFQLRLSSYCHFRQILCTFQNTKENCTLIRIGMEISMIFSWYLRKCASTSTVDVKPRLKTAKPFKICRCPHQKLLAMVKPMLPHRKIKFTHAPG